MSIEEREQLRDIIREELNNMIANQLAIARNIALASQAREIMHQNGVL